MSPHVAKLYLNDGAGSGVLDLGTLEGILKDVGLDAEIIMVSPGQNLTTMAKDAVARGATLLVAGGGDGTVQAVAAGVLDGPAVLGILPLGTLNHFARDAGIPKDPRAAAGVLADGVVRRVDVGTINGEVFLNTSSIGYYPELVRSRPAIRGRLRRGIATTLAAARVVRDRRALTVSLVAGDITRTITTPFVFVGNNDYGLRRLGFNARTRLDGGVLCIYVLRTVKVWPTLRTVARILLGRGHVRDVFEELLVPAATLTLGGQEVLVSRDGEVGTHTGTLRYAVRPHALAVMVPAG